MKALLILAMSAGAACAELPEFYKQVDRVVFVVPNVEKALAAWKPSGVVEVFGGPRDAQFAAEYKGGGTQSSMRFAVGRIGDVLANWMQPVTGANAMSDFLERKGAGIFSLMHRVPTIEDLAKEVLRMEGLGVGVLQRGSMGGDSQYVFFDTQTVGKYTLGIYYQPEDGPPFPADTPKVTQFAFMIRDDAAVSKYWARLGWPVMSITHPELRDLSYKGKPAEFKSRLGWMRHGKIVYEWVIPEKGPSTWEDHLAKHGEGVHHVAFNVEDMDRALAQWQKAGYSYAMGGAWGEAGKRGSGRFAYLDTQAAGGIDVELLWNFR